MFFLRLLTRDQQTKWVRAGFLNTSGGFPHSPRWRFRIFFTKKNFDFFSQFVASVAGTTGSSLSSARSPLHPKPTWQLQVSLGPLLLWHTADSLSAHLAHTQTFPGDGHATTLGETQGRGKALLLSVRSMGTTEPKSRLECSCHPRRWCTQAKLPSGLGMIRTLNDAGLGKLRL